MDTRAIDNRETTTIYVKVIDENMDYYMPLEAEKNSNGYFILPTDVDDSCDEWEFPPGSAVKVEEKHLSGGPCLVAVERVTENVDQDS